MIIRNKAYALLTLAAVLLSTAASARTCRQFFEPIDPAFGGGYVIITICCEGGECELVECQDFPIEGDPACPECVNG